jgi:hypothetical protein
VPEPGRISRKAELVKLHVRKRVPVLTTAHHCQWLAQVKLKDCPEIHVLKTEGVFLGIRADNAIAEHFDIPAYGFRTVGLGAYPPDTASTHFIQPRTLQQKADTGTPK